MMRRNDRALADRAQLEDILIKADVCHLALNTGGAPYVVPLNFGYEWGDSLKLFFHCAAEGRKLDLIRTDPRAGFEIDIAHELVTGDVACDWGMKYRSLVGTGVITELADPDEKKAALDRIMAQYGYRDQSSYSDAMLSAVRVLCLAVSDVSGKARA